MDIDVFSSQELDFAFRALRTALNPTGALSPKERLFLETYARITGYRLPPGDPQPIEVENVRVDRAHPRKRLIQLCALAALLSNPVKPESAAFLRRLSEQLETRDAIVDVVDAVQRGRRVKARLLAVRRSFRMILKGQYAAEGPMGVLRFVGAMFFGMTVNKDKVWDYRRLGLLPEGTLGREYWKHLTAVGFPFPGERNGIPDAIAYHDVGHVIADHETTPLGEIQQGSFQGGNRREDGFAFVQFVILHFHHGIQVTPVTPAQTGNFEPDKVLWAIHRGAMCSVDITHKWDFWPLMPLPLEEARARINLLPKLPARLARAA